MDIPADVAFVGQDNALLLTMAKQMLSHAESTLGRKEIELRFADFLRNGADQAVNTLDVAEKRGAQAKAGLDVAMAGTDLAKGRVKNIDQKMSEIKTVLENEFEQQDGPFAVMTQILDVGIAVGQIAVGVGTGVGAIIEVGRGFPTLQKTANGATGLFDLVKDVKNELNNGSLKKFKTALKDVKEAGEKVYFNVDKLVSELDGIKSTHPDPRIRELAALQRERVLLVQEQALHTQMEKEAQLGMAAAEAEKAAIKANAALSKKLESDIRTKAEGDIDEVVDTLLVTMRQLLDALSVRVFATIRAKEIYLALDPVELARHDLGRLHPDREQMMPKATLLATLRKDLDNRTLPIIQWSSLVDDVIATADLSRGPISFSFSTSDATMVQALRTTRRVGFYVPVEDLFEEDGSQLFEAKFDGVTVVLKGAKLPPNTSAETIKLRQLGRWAVRRRPESRTPTASSKSSPFRPRRSSPCAGPSPAGWRPTWRRRPTRGPSRRSACGDVVSPGTGAGRQPVGPDRPEWHRGDLPHSGPVVDLRRADERSGADAACPPRWTPDGHAAAVPDQGADPPRLELQLPVRRRQRHGRRRGPRRCAPSGRSGRPRSPQPGLRHGEANATTCWRGSCRSSWPGAITIGPRSSPTRLAPASSSTASGSSSTRSRCRSSAFATPTRRGGPPASSSPSASRTSHSSTSTPTCSCGPPCRRH